MGAGGAGLGGDILRPDFPSPAGRGEAAITIRDWAGPVQAGRFKFGAEKPVGQDDVAYGHVERRKLMEHIMKHE